MHRRLNGWSKASKVRIEERRKKTRERINAGLAARNPPCISRCRSWGIFNVCGARERKEIEKLFSNVVSVSEEVLEQEEIGERRNYTAANPSNQLSCGFRVERAQMRHRSNYIWKNFQKYLCY